MTKMYQSTKSFFILAGLILFISAMGFSNGSTVKRGADDDAFDNLFNAMADSLPRQKRQNRVAPRDGKPPLRRKVVGSELHKTLEDLAAEPTVRHTSSIGYRNPTTFDDFVPSEVDRFARATPTPRMSTTPRDFEELVDLITPQGQRHNNNLPSPSRNNPFTLTTPVPTTFSSIFTNRALLTSQVQPQFQSTTPFPVTSSGQNEKLTLNENTRKLKTGNGVPVQQTSIRSEKKNTKKKNQNKNDNRSPKQFSLFNNVNTLGQSGSRRQGKQSLNQPSLTFANPNPATSSTSVSKFLGQKVIVDGFPNGLPAQVPEGVRIALASATRGPDGEFIMNPIPGTAGVDFPVLASVPQTGFDCNVQQFPGIYADVDADCQVFHMCQPNGNSDSFLCPNGTIFNQQYFICDWWYNVDCAANPNFFALNEFIYQDQPEGNSL